MLTRWGGVALLLLVAFPVRADDVRNAREHYRQATKAYELGLYDEAIREYTEAYRAKDDPAILYNMAQAHRLAEHNQEALRLYKMFLIKVSDAANRAEVMAKIEMLEKLIEQQKRAKSIPPDTTLSTVSHSDRPPAQPPPPARQAPVSQPAAAPVVQSSTSLPERAGGRGKKIAGLAIGVVGVAAIGAGVAMEILATQSSDSLGKADENGQPFNRGKYDTGKSENLAGGVLLGIGGAAVVAGVVVGILGLRESRSRKVALLPWIGRSSAGATVEIRP